VADSIFKALEAPPKYSIWTAPQSLRCGDTVPFFLRSLVTFSLRHRLPSSSLSKPLRPSTYSIMLGHTEEYARSSADYSSNLSDLRKKIAYASARSSALVWEWTPFCLVASYFVFSTCIYMVCSEKMIEVLWYVYMLTNTYVSMVTVVEAVLSISATREARGRVTKIAALVNRYYTNLV
jgi:hypothetical protein